MRPSLAVVALAGLAAAAAAQEPVDTSLARFYDARWGQPAWIRPGGISPEAEQLLAVLTHAERDGLDPRDYLTPALDALLHRHLLATEHWVLDSLLTRAFLLYARDVSRGRVEPAAVDTQWTAAPRAIDPVSVLNGAADGGEAGSDLAAIAPPQPGYRALRAALQRYRELALAPWPAGLGQRLAAEGYDTAAGLDSALRQFQTRHGLVADGIIGPATRAALDISAAARAEQIAVNLERWRWLPRELGARHIVVNTAAFTLELVEHDSVAWTTRAIVGRVAWPTPILSSPATHLLFRPAWKVPRIIAAHELLPLIQRDTGYLGREGFHVEGLDSGTIDWSAVTPSTFAYQLVQDPGGDNPLGGVKLVFANPYAVFIHDTPARPLFSERWRTFSHGCVRVERAADLVARLLPDWSADSIQAAMSNGRERWVRLPQPVPVHLVYWTAWITEDGRVAFADDPYGWDIELARALHARRVDAITMTEGPLQ